MPGKGAFKRCVDSVSRKGGAADPRAVCAASLSKTMGRGELEKAAARARRTLKRKNLTAQELIDPANILQLTPTGQALLSIEGEREKLERKLKAKGNRKKAAAKNPSWRKSVKHTKKVLRRLGAADADKPILAKKQWKAARKKNGRKNPRNPAEAAQAGYERFHGRRSEQWISDTIRIHDHEYVSAIGELVRLVVRTPRGYEVTIKNFGANANGNPAMLTMAEDLNTPQLFIDGGDQSVNLEDFDVPTPYHESVVLGEVERVVYFTTKDHLAPEDGGTANYDHKFGGMVEDENGKRHRSEKPFLLYDTRNKLLYFAGGGYTLPDEGIDG